jgi:glycosyltransferase involved in cell wall biosynthesis
MLSGKAVVATSIGGPTEIVKDQLTGFLVPPNQPNIMANRILELVGNPELRAEFGSNGRQLALKKFTVTTMLEKIEFYYQELGQTISPPANNLCFISGEFPPQVGGVGDYTYQVARALDQQKKNVTILTRQTKREAVIEGGISLNIVPVISQANLDFRTVFRLLNYFGKNRFETVFYQYVPQMYGYAGINLLSGLVPLVARLAGIKKVVTVFHEVSTRPKDSPNRLKGTVMWAFQSLQATLLALTSQHLITNNPENGERLNRLLRNFGQSKRCEVLPVGSNIPLTKFARTNRDTLRESVGVAPHQTLLVIFSPFTIGKDLETCLQALKQLPGAKLLCIGGKADKTLASTLIQKAKVLGVQAQLHLISGPLAGETVSAWLQACDIYLHPGDGGASGRSTALAAAMQHALPVVAYCGAETDSSFRDGENICLIPPKEVKAMVKAIENLQQNKNFARNLASNAAHYYREKADWSVIAKRLNTLIES